MTERQEWLEAYRAEFKRFACDRQGWEAIDAGAWAQMLSDDALGAYYQHGLSPEEAAQTDVLACEEDHTPCTNNH
jgi:hypothetical protein